ncbi:hypothetical protein ADEAN_000018600 [Angomonas deanei]|uniref:Uncharacterized protein n=1 Tax=Angomonas deanei TaxID=59799 RepID=A0A7G2C0D4_9TRYP|nr:hypothetical protein ADEAN_000018600 [Angomonas deanei]
MLCHTSPGWSLVEATGQSDDNFNSCSAVTRCSECVYDPADGLMPPALSCGWCASTGTCTEVNRSILSLYLLSDEMLNTSARKKRDNFCPDLRHRKHNPSCPDMSCSAAYRTNNIYFCRASSIVALVFACLLLPLNVAALLWARTITQLPWVYEPYLRTLVHNEKEHKNSDKEKYEAVLKEVKDKIDNEVHLRQNPRLATNSNNNSNNSNNSAPKLLRGKCPICGRVKPSLLGPGEVCVWCNAARLCFLPLTIGLLVMSLILIFSFVLSLKPWFSDVYFYVLLAFAYGAYLAAYVYLRHQSRVLIQPFRQSAGLDPQLAAENEVLLLLQSTLYVHLTVWLRGRNLLKVFPMLEPLRHRERAPTGTAAAHPNAGPAKAEHVVPKAPKPKKKPHVRFEEEMTTREEGKETEVVVDVDDEFPLPTAIPSDMNTPHFSRSTNSESMFSTSGYSPELSQLQHTVQSNTNHNNHNNGPSSQTHGMNSRVNIIEKVVDPIPPTLRKQKKTETLHLLSTDILSAQNRKILKETLFRDEIVLLVLPPSLFKNNARLRLASHQLDGGPLLWCLDWYPR